MTMTFWEHLDELRGCLIRVLVAVFLCSVALFCCKEALFYCVLAPSRPDFVSYRLFAALTGTKVGFDVALFNPELTQQFMAHVKMSLWGGLLVVSPYVLYVLFHFVAPALYSRERHYAVRAVGGGYVMFMMGVALGYFLIFPLTFRFLATYQVDAAVPNVIALSDYVSMLLLLCFLMGVVFELPVVSWLLAKMGVLKADWMRRYRRHALVVILIVAAVLTPTGDALTLTVVSFPIYLLFELSIFIVRRSQGVDAQSGVSR